jgi:hypothetical protein
MSGGVITNWYVLITGKLVGRLWMVAVYEFRELIPLDVKFPDPPGPVGPTSPCDPVGPVGPTGPTFGLLPVLPVVFLNAK